MTDVTPATMRDFPSPHVTNASHGSEDQPPGLRPEELVKRPLLSSQEVLQDVSAAVWMSQGQEQYRPAQGVPRRHSGQQLNPPPLTDLGCADRTGPDTPAGLQPGEVRGTMDPRPNHIDPRSPSPPNPKTPRRPRLRARNPSDRLKRKTLQPNRCRRPFCCLENLPRFPGKISCKINAGVRFRTITKNRRPQTP
jgi:hypothetical protein